MDPLQLTTGQAFEQERFARAIDATTDPTALQRIARQLLQAWMVQRAATAWVMRQNLPEPWHAKAPATAAAGASITLEGDQEAGSVS